MSKAPLPAGYHDADSAAELLGISKRKLLQRMREMGWLIVGGDQHNLPRQELKRAGLLSTQDRAHCLKGKKEIVKTYQVMLLSQAGFIEIKKIMTTTPEAKPVTQIHSTTKLAVIQAQQPKADFDKESADVERQKCLENLREWGLAS